MSDLNVSMIALDSYSNPVSPIRLKTSISIVSAPFFLYFYLSYLNQMGGEIMSEKKFEININANPLPDSTTEALLNPSAEVIGKGLSGMFHFLLKPLVEYSIVREYDLEQLAQGINNKTESIPEENRDDSKFGLVLKSFEDSKYQLNDSDMREYFSNLIANTVDNRMNHQVLPSFSTVLKQMSPQDAKLLEKIYRTGALPLVEIQIYSQFSRLSIAYKDSVVLFEDAPQTDLDISIASLNRLGLIELIPDRKLAYNKFDTYHESFEKSEFLQSIKDDLPMKIDGETYDLLKPIYGSVLLTSYGENFSNMVISGDRDPDSVLYPS